MTAIDTSAVPIAYVAEICVSDVARSYSAAIHGPLAATAIIDNAIGLFLDLPCGLNPAGSRGGVFLRLTFVEV